MFVTLPNFDLQRTKADLLIQSKRIKNALRSLANNNDIVYIPGKLLFLAPWFKEANSSLRILIHLHDYQLICPHSTLLNMLKHRTCDQIWSDVDCTRCTQKFLQSDGNDLPYSLLGTLPTLYWKHVARPLKIIDSVDLFITVSNRQTHLINRNLDQHPNEFQRKNIMLYNPVDSITDYVPSDFGKLPCLGFFGGNRFIKGYTEMLKLINHLYPRSVKLFASKMTFSSDGQTFESVGVLDSRQMVNAFKKVWIVLFTSVMEETSSYIVVESQLRGRPVIACPVGGIPENIVKMDFTGSLLGAQDYDRFKYLVEYYSRRLRADPYNYTLEISELSKDFFRKRTDASYNTFLNLVS